MIKPLFFIMLATTSCQDNQVPAASEINFDAVYKTKSGFEVRYVLDVDGSVQRWNVFRPLEPREKYRTLTIQIKEKFVIFGDFLIIPLDINKENSWSFDGINCKNMDYTNTNSIISVKIKCEYNDSDGYLIYKYSQERGISYLEEGCDRCGDDEIETLASKVGLGARISN